MRIGDGTPPPAPPAASRPRYQTPAAELHGHVLDAFNRATFVTRMALADALRYGTPWANLPANVQGVFEEVAEEMGLDT